MLKYPLGLLLVSLILLSGTTFQAFYGFIGVATANGGESQTSNGSEPFYVGATFCGNTSAEAKVLIDRVKNYTNFFVLQSGPISKNETAMNEICDYSAASGLRFIVLFAWFDPACPWQIPWLDFAKQRWGNNFLGVYYYDEPGGIELDYNWTISFLQYKTLNNQRYQILGPAIDAYLNGSLTRDYDTAAMVYTNAIRDDSGINRLKNESILSFTSEYALYWFTYMGGFDVLLAQFGWNSSITQTIDLVRGAANMQNKTWGVTITWKYNTWPYLDTGEEVYNQMVTAYDAGAKYITIFNYANYSQGITSIMQDEHFAAMEKFWSYIKEHSPKAAKADAVLVLPQNYGWGMRRPNDRIWFWGPDGNSSQIWDVSRKLLSIYGTKLDIVYDDPAYSIEGKYQYVYYWNMPINYLSALPVLEVTAGTGIALLSFVFFVVKRRKRA
jgi:hypothetical protein